MRIPLTRGQFAIVDDADYGILRHLKWRTVGTETKGFYAETGRNRTRILMHRMLLKLPDDVETDHKDGNGLNNQRHNIRPSTRSQNNMNRRPWNGTYKGVRLFPAEYRAYINKTKRRIFLEAFSTVEEAALAYDIAAREHHGEFASLNFPPGSIPPLPSTAGISEGLL
jgi:hypothetical protein